MDHFFDQDLRALEAHPRLDVRRFPYQRLRGPALRMLGAQVATGLDAYADPRLARARGRYGSWLAREVRRLYLERAFDVIVLPSDTFFYVRALPQAAHSLGLPVVVVQKETTISIDTMEEHSLVVGEFAPMVADVMTVCSDRHRQFWLRAGADAARIEVSGQPRFDMYALPRPRRSHRRLVLFLTYELDAYAPGAGGGMGWRTWGPLRDATEGVLLHAVREGTCDVLVKCHPQQDHRAEAARLSQRAGALWNHGVSIAGEDADTRELIVGADVVVGFQTTALYEAVAAQRPVVYAAWGEEYERHRARLIPFEQAPAACLRRADSAESLAALLAGPEAAEAPVCRAWYEDALGPIDGHATDRVAARLEAMAASWPPTSARRDLEAERRRFATGLLARALAVEMVWTVSGPMARMAGQERRVTARRRRARERRVMAMTALRRRGA
jgi:hypothetical protein